MRIVKSLIAILIVGLLVAGLAGCSSTSTTATTSATKQVQVSIGTISNAITGSATLGLAKTEDVAFEMAGYVESILVEESESVTEGQLLATLDNSTWEETIKTLKSNLITAQRNLNDKEYALTKAQRVIETKEMALKEAELSLRSAQDNLNDIEEVSTAQKAVDALNDDIAYAEASRRAARALDDTALASEWTEQIRYLNEDLQAAEARLALVLQGAGISDENVALQIAQAVFAVEQAEKSVADAQTAIEDAQLDVENAQLDVDDAQDDVETAQAKLEEEEALSSTVVAPFDGFITGIKVSGGDEVYKGTVAVQIADTNQFEASFSVSESDIFQIEVGQSAVVEVDANAESYPAVVTAIAPLATTSSGVVTYDVTAELTSLVPISSTTDTASTLKEGLSATVTITIEEKQDVLVVPSRAITTLNGKTTVEVVDGTATQTVEVTTGLSDDSNTEIVSGLTEGQTVVVKASGSSSTSEFGPGGGMMMMP